MKVSDLLSKTYDHIVLYKSFDGDYVDIFVGEKKDVPCDMLKLEICVFSCRSQGVLDIHVNI